MVIFYVLLALPPVTLTAMTSGMTITRRLRVRQ